MRPRGPLRFRAIIPKCVVFSAVLPLTGVGRDACRAILHTVVLHGLSLPACVSFSSQVDGIFDPPSSNVLLSKHIVCTYSMYVYVGMYICMCVCIYMICMYVCMYVSRVHPRPFSSTLKHSLIRPDVCCRRQCKPWKCVQTQVSGDGGEGGQNDNYSLY